MKLHPKNVLTFYVYPFFSLNKNETCPKPSQVAPLNNGWEKQTERHISMPILELTFCYFTRFLLLLLLLPQLLMQGTQLLTSQSRASTGMIIGVRPRTTARVAGGAVVTVAASAVHDGFFCGKIRKYSVFRRLLLVESTRSSKQPGAILRISPPFLGLYARFFLN